mmetsp:Transcript_41197/g.110081  ORF Transcript_41197/g.110081 Transcript_41197/m.110081 type:complete len:94 (+) Transcript_41197:221-502(+)
MTRTLLTASVLVMYSPPLLFLVTDQLLISSRHLPRPSYSEFVLVSIKETHSSILAVYKLAVYMISNSKKTGSDFNKANSPFFLTIYIPSFVQS